MKGKKDPREAALKRYALIAPLFEPGMEEAETRRRREEILGRETLPVSARTLRRYTARYREQGFDGLCPKRRTDAGNPMASMVQSPWMGVMWAKARSRVSSQRQCFS